MLDEVFLYAKLQKCFFRFFKREQFTDSALALNKTKRVFLIATRAIEHRVFSLKRERANFEHSVHKESFIARTKHIANAIIKTLLSDNEYSAIN